MGLKVWLPLLGNLNQQGCSNVTVSSNAITVNTAGKIGSCYQFNGTSSYIKLSSSVFSTATTEFSYACWFKPASTASGCLFSCRTATNNLGITLFINNSGNILYDIGGERRTKAYTLAANTWYHITFTYKKGGTKVIYINGAQIDSVSSTASMTQVASNNMFIGASQSADGTVNANYLNGYLNDVRIYDHCLSAAEVREISQGLVLHYKLNDAPILCKTNLTTWSKESGVTSTAQDDGSVKIDCTAKTSSRWGIYCDIQNVLPNTPYTFSVDCKTAHVNKKWQLSVGCNPVPSGTSQFGSNRATMNSTSEFTTYTATVTTNTDTTWIRFYLALSCSSTTPEYQYAFVKNVKMTIGTSLQTTIQDSSGYNHNGTILNTVSISSDTPRYSCSTKLEAANSMINCGRGGMVTDSITVNFWLKSSSWANPVSCTEGGGWNFEASGNYFRFPVYVSGVGYKYGQSSTTKTQICNNEWHMLTGIYDRINQKVQIYVDGQLDNDYATGTSNNIGYHGSNCIWIGAEATGSNTTASNGMAGLFSDFRIYCTALDADAIRQLYEVGAKVDNKGNLHAFELIEEQNNIFSKIEFNRTLLQWGDGLGRYQQANNTTTLTEDGLRIYRPPNLTQANNGKTMWGGMKLINQSTDSIHPYDPAIDNIWGLQKNHTYLWAFHVKGQSSQASENIIINHNMGNGVNNGVGPNPTIIAGDRTIPANFQGEKDCYLIFTITDDLVKTSTKDTAGFLTGQQYLSYRHLQFYWGYGSTGELGTDIYVTNIRLYDVTNHMAEFTKMGQAKFFDFIEQMNKCQIRKNSELLATEFIEL